MNIFRWLFTPSTSMPALSAIGDWDAANPYHGERRYTPGFGYREWDSPCMWWRAFSEGGEYIGVVCPEWEARRDNPEYAELYAALQNRLARLTRR